MAWLLLIVAGLLEVVWAYAMIGVVALAEPASAMRLLAAALIVSGLVLMKFASQGWP